MDLEPQVNGKLPPVPLVTYLESTSTQSHYCSLTIHNNVDPLSCNPSNSVYINLYYVKDNLLTNYGPATFPIDTSEQFYNRTTLSKEKTSLLSSLHHQNRRHPTSVRHPMRRPSAVTESRNQPGQTSIQHDNTASTYGTDKENVGAKELGNGLETRRW
jgi:hypothetical protein